MSLWWEDDFPGILETVNQEMHALYRLMRNDIITMFGKPIIRLSYLILQPIFDPNPNVIYVHIWPQGSGEKPHFGNLRNVASAEELHGLSFTRVGENGFNILVSIAWPDDTNDLTSVERGFFYRVIRNDNETLIDEDFIEYKMYMMQEYKEIFPLHILCKHPDLVRDAVLGDLARLFDLPLRNFPTIERLMARPKPERFPHYVAWPIFKAHNELTRENVEKWWLTTLDCIRIEDDRDKFDFAVFYDHCVAGIVPAKAYWIEFASPLWPCNISEVTNTRMRKKNNTFDTSLQHLKNNQYRLIMNRSKMARDRFWDVKFQETLNMRTSHEFSLTIDLTLKSFIDAWHIAVWTLRKQPEKYMHKIAIWSGKTNPNPLTEFSSGSSDFNSMAYEVYGGASVPYVEDLSEAMAAGAGVPEPTSISTRGRGIRRGSRGRRGRGRLLPSANDDSCFIIEELCETAPDTSLMVMGESHVSGSSELGQDAAADRWVVPADIVYPSDNDGHG